MADDRPNGNKSTEKTTPAPAAPSGDKAPGDKAAADKPANKSAN
ncbi:hypothetical protein [Pantoea dispersa]